MILNVNTGAAVEHVNTLEKMHKSALPSAIRGALNKAVFDVKTNTLLKSADDTFVKRQANFFKANSKFENAKGFQVSSMKATIGMIEDKLNGDNNYAVKDLEQQEEGGKIDRKSFIPTVFARKGNSFKALVKPNMRLKKIRNIIKASDSEGKNDREKFIIAASVAGKGGFVLRKNILFHIDSNPMSGLKKRNTIIKATPVYSVKSGRKVAVKSTGFMKKASISTAKKIEGYFIEEAKRQIAKLK